MGRYYRDYADFLADRFPGRKMQKLTVDAGFSCPNRDGFIHSTVAKSIVFIKSR